VTAYFNGHVFNFFEWELQWGVHPQAQSLNAKKPPAFFNADGCEIFL
jgi:hypothetical protein